MKTFLFFAFALVIFMTLIARVEKVHAAELFGDGTALAFETSHAEAGFIASTWPGGTQFLFGFAGFDGRGYIVKLFGPAINQYGPYVHSNSFAFYYERQTQIVWSGRIEFRGHDRPFCGGERIPANCMWK